MIKIAFLRFYEFYKSVMDANVNPLRHVPDPVSRFWIMTVMAWMWCVFIWVAYYLLAAALLGT